MSTQTRGFEIVKHRNVEPLRTKLKEKGIEVYESKPVMPMRGTPRSCAYDFFYEGDTILIQPNTVVAIATGIKAYMQPTEKLDLMCRSSQSIDGIILANIQAKIDSDFYNNPTNEGEITVMLRSFSNVVYEIKNRDRICQGEFGVYLVADNDQIKGNSRQGGLGSTGK